MKNRSVMVPYINISILTSKHSHNSIATDDKDLGATYFFTPSRLESLSVDDAQLSFICSKN